MRQQMYEEQQTSHLAASVLLLLFLLLVFLVLLELDTNRWHCSLGIGFDPQSIQTDCMTPVCLHHNNKTKLL